MKTKFDYHRLIVNCFCDFEKGTYGVKLNDAIKVFDEYPDPEFWEWMIINCNFKVHDLNFFLMEEGKRFVQDQYKLMNHKPSKSFTNVRLSDKLGEDKVYPKKNKTLLDFVRDGKKKEDK